VTLSDLGSIGEFVGGLLVVASLFYLASQIRQNTRAMRVAAYQDAVRAANDVSVLQVQNSGLGSLLERGARDPATLDDAELSQIDHILSMILRNYSVVMVLERDGFLDVGDISIAYEAYLREIFASPSTREWWDQNKQFFAQSAHDHIAKLFAV
jgi:hypothetical protein